VTGSASGTAGERDPAGAVADREAGDVAGATAADVAWMRAALGLAGRGAAAGEVPVGALVVRDGQAIGEGWNGPVGAHDPSAHAEIVALRTACERERNYRLPGATLYATMEPCPMCAGAIVHARIARVVFAAHDEKWGAAGSVFDILGAGRLNHRPEVLAGVLAEDSAEMLRAFFRARR